MMKNAFGLLILWTILLILGLTLSVIAMVFTFNGLKDHPQYYPWLGLLGGAALSAYSTLKLIEVNNAWKEELKNTILRDEERQIAHWRYSLQLWNRFAELEIKRKTKWGSYTLWGMMVVIFIGIGWAIWAEDNFNWKVFLPVTLLLFLIAFGIQFLINKNNLEMKKAYLNSVQPEVHLHALGALINRSWLIPFKSFGVDLEQVALEKHHEEDCVKFSVRHSGGETEVVHDFYVLVPDKEKERSPLIVEAYQKIIEA